MSVRMRYLATTVALFTFAVAIGVCQWKARPGSPRPAAHATARPALPAPPPTAREILNRSEPLGLSAQQSGRLRELDRQWQADSGELQAAIQAASAEFELFVGDVRRGGGASVPELQRRSADLQSLSAELRERRVPHSRRAIEILTGAQRALLQRDLGPGASAYRQGANGTAEVARHGFQ